MYDLVEAVELFELTAVLSVGYSDAKVSSQVFLFDVDTAR